LLLLWSFLVATQQQIALCPLQNAAQLDKLLREEKLAAKRVEQAAARRRLLALDCSDPAVIEGGTKVREKLAAEATAALKSARACGFGAPCPSSKKGARMWVQGEAGDAAALESAEGVLEKLRRVSVNAERRMRAKVVDIRAKVSDAIDDPAAAARFGDWLGSLDPECVPAADRNSVFQFVMRAAGATSGGKQGKKGKKGGDAAVWKTHDGRMLAVVAAMVAKNELFSKANIAELQVRGG